MPTVSTRPPNRLGEILSTCSEPEETSSPCMANCSSSIFDSGLGSSALAATTAATAEAAEPPRPLPSGMPLWIEAAESEARIQRLLHGQQRASRGVLLRIARNVRDHAAGASHHHAGRVGALHRDRIAEHIDRESQDVEADGDVRRRGRRERRAPLSSTHKMRPDVRAHPQQIGEHARRGDLGTRAGTLHDERVRVVTRRGVAHHVVGERDIGEGMRPVELGHTHRGLAIGGEPAHITQHFAARGRLRRNASSSRRRIRAVWPGTRRSIPSRGPAESGSPPARPSSRA